MATGVPENASPVPLVLSGSGPLFPTQMAVGLWKQQEARALFLEQHPPENPGEGDCDSAPRAPALPVPSAPPPRAHAQPHRIARPASLSEHRVPCPLLPGEVLALLMPLGVTGKVTAIDWGPGLDLVPSMRSLPYFPSSRTWLTLSPPARVPTHPQPCPHSHLLPRCQFLYQESPASLPVWLSA